MWQKERAAGENWEARLQAMEGAAFSLSRLICYFKRPSEARMVEIVQLIGHSQLPGWGMFLAQTRYFVGTECPEVVEEADRFLEP